VHGQLDASRMESPASDHVIHSLVRVHSEVVGARITVRHCPDHLSHALSFERKKALNF
jgi:hypothetical protein